MKTPAGYVSYIAPIHDAEYERLQAAYERLLDLVQSVEGGTK